MQVKSTTSIAKVNDLIMCEQPTFNPDSSGLRRDVVLLDRWSLPSGLPLARGEIVTVRSVSLTQLTLLLVRRSHVSFL